MSKTVFVLGAGFTRAFVPDMPLLYDDKIVDDLLNAAKYLPAAAAVLEAELAMCSDGKVNIERLMTRLDSGAPYDGTGKDHLELQLMLVELKRLFSARIDEARHPGIDSDLLNFADKVIDAEWNCISFNYDEMLDKYLWICAENVKRRNADNAHEWDPHTGYGFVVRDVKEWSGGRGNDNPTTLLLKLHGSVGWRIVKGQTAPYPLSSLVLVQPWAEEYPYDADDLSAYLGAVEDSPFIVPPVLLKTELRIQPVFSVIWSKAFDVLRTAEEVVFIGYSLPITDLAAVALFSEAVKDAKLTVVTLGGNEGAERIAKDAYGRVWPNREIKFEFKDAKEWVGKSVGSES